MRKITGFLFALLSFCGQSLYGMEKQPLFQAGENGSSETYGSAVEIITQESSGQEALISWMNLFRDKKEIFDLDKIRITDDCTLVYVDVIHKKVFAETKSFDELVSFFENDLKAFLEKNPNYHVVFKSKRQYVKVLGEKGVAPLVSHYKKSFDCKKRLDRACAICLVVFVGATVCLLLVGPLLYCDFFSDHRGFCPALKNTTANSTW